MDMRVTIQLDDDLHAEVKRWAAQTGRTMSAVIENALRDVLARRKRQQPTERVSLPKHHGSGLRPGVNLDSNAELLDLMDGFDPAD